MNQVSEEIDGRILRILGIEDVFDLDYDTYLTLLKEAIVKGSFGKSKMPDDELSLLANERKRVRGEKGRFKVKEKITADKFATSKLLKPAKKSLALVPKGGSFGYGGSGSIVGGDLLDISRKLDGILRSLTEQNKLDKKSEEDKRKTREEERRKRKESRLESTIKPILSAAKKVLAPVQGILDSIARFIIFTVLGRAFKMFMDWASDPKNQEKIKVLGRFLKDWWPALLGAWFFFANPLGRFIRSVVGTVLKLTFKIGKFAIPKLLSFIRSHPLVTAGVLTGLATFGAEKWRQDEENKQITKEAKERNTKPEVVKSDLNQAKSSPWAMFGDTFSKMGPFGAMSGGGDVGSFFSGVVDRNTGSYVSGAGPDTQFFPIAGGGGAVLQKGESVLQVGARERMIQETGVDPLAYNIGPNANKPRTLGNNILASSLGGILGFAGGGSIGIAAHHLKKDEALSSLTPGINNFTRPGGTDWSKVSPNTTIYSYLDSVGKATIGWGSTYYDSILNGKKPVRMGDTINKGKADAILYNNIMNLSKEYSNKIPYWNKMTDKQQAGILMLGYNAPYGPIGAYPKLTKSLQMGDILSASQNLQRGGPNQQRINLEKSLLMSGPTNLKTARQDQTTQSVQRKTEKQPNFLQRLTSGLSSMFTKPRKYKTGGTIIGEQTGKDIPGGKEDRQMINVAVQPGEAKYVFTRTATQRGAVELADLIQAKLDPSGSKAGMSGKYTLPPPKRSKGGVQVLPPIKKSGGKVSRPGQAPETVVPSFPVISSAAYSTRSKIIETYGIM